ncbi:MAG TPA: hypothetical protein DHU69_00015 [Deltaproteobacteria bacterium]|nr:MAG: hypothetical protein A2067_07295 [Deltaproteobacteria bacterium GWB2_42_7]OGP41265.1 MAG: hypothetical protein A2090_05045 [Deltaproteobacteria bacterium GWD2_42_10]OGP47541.1 MAG: hypothetical protein A2022_09080 [Deltaproteobacteria bacterium GWF2_42_12]OGQ73925.1 MAG: hypothetical protein A2235_01845 [Deltaproteobacteria bacterium RIFOXYA2_FULL_42_10]HCY18169.1 hypothetical protein [Deltaproteobacteria bacterium]
MSLREVLHLIAQVIISPRAAMGEIRQRPRLWVLFIYPLMAILIIFFSSVQTTKELSVFSFVIGAAFLSILFGGLTAFLAAILYAVSRYYSRTIGYLTFLSGLAFSDIPILIEHLMRALFPYLNRTTNSGNNHFIISVATLFPNDLDITMPFIFSMTAYVLEPFYIWTFGLWVFLVSSFCDLTIVRSLLIALLLLIFFPILLTIMR